MTEICRYKNIYGFIGTCPAKTIGRAVAILCLMAAAKVGPARADNLTLNAYYPSPFGAYSKLRLIPRGTAAGSCQIGRLYVEEKAGNTDLLRYCNDDGTGSGIWGPLPGAWTQSGSNIYLTDTTASPPVFVGIGTNAPADLLHINHTGGTGLSDPSTLRLHNDTPNGSSQIIFDEGALGSGDGQIILRYQGATDDLEITNSDGSAVRLHVNRSDGRTGIGTTSPQDTLHVADAGQVRLEAASPHFFWEDNGGGDNFRWQLDNTVAGTLRLQAQPGGIWQNMASVNSSRRVGIGTTNLPTYQNKLTGTPLVYYDPADLIISNGLSPNWDSWQDSTDNWFSRIGPLAVAAPNAGIHLISEDASVFSGFVTLVDMDPTTGEGTERWTIFRSTTSNTTPMSNGLHFGFADYPDRWWLKNRLSTSLWADGKLSLGGMLYIKNDPALADLDIQIPSSHYRTTILDSTPTFQLRDTDDADWRIVVDAGKLRFESGDGPSDSWNTEITLTYKFTDNGVASHLGIGGMLAPGSPLTIDASLIPGVVIDNSRHYKLVLTATGAVKRESSSARYKTNIQPLTDTFSRILSLEPKKFVYTATGQEDFGYIAEELDALGLKQLVVYEPDGQVSGIKYDRLPLYVIEVLKENRPGLPHMETTVANLQKQLQEQQEQLNRLQRSLRTSENTDGGKKP